jgi:hypothetical protein
MFQQPFISNHRTPTKKPTKVKVESKSNQAKFNPANASTIYTSKWIPANSGGLMASIRVDGKVVFPERNGPQPKHDGRQVQWTIVGQNPKGSVYFARLIDPNAKNAPIEIEMRADGKIVCVSGRKPVKYFKSTKEKKLAEFRSSSTLPKDFAVTDDDDDFLCDDGTMGRCGYACCTGDIRSHADSNIDDDEPDESDDELDEGDDHYGLGLAFYDDAYRFFDFIDNMPTIAKTCFACGSQDCMCDGTHTVWVPYRTSMNVID